MQGTEEERENAKRAKRLEKRLHDFAALTFGDQLIEIKQYESAGEILCGGRVAYLLLYNGHFWDALNGMYEYLGPNAEIASMLWRNKQVKHHDLSEECFKEAGLKEHERERMRKLFDVDENGEKKYSRFLDDDDDEESTFLKNCMKINAKGFQPDYGDPELNPPAEWSERIASSLAKWERMDMRTGKTEPMMTNEPPQGFQAFVDRVRKILKRHIGCRVYDDDGREYAAEIYVGRNKDGTACTSYLTKVGGCYYETNRCTFLETLGCNPVKAAEFWLECLGMYEREPPAGYNPYEGDGWGGDWEGPDMEGYDPTDKRWLIPEEWSEICEEAKETQKELQRQP
jgi:hypothetical protein